MDFPFLGSSDWFWMFLGGSGCLWSNPWFWKTVGLYLYIPVEFFKMCLKKSCFHIVGRSHLRSLHWRMLGRDLKLKVMVLLVFLLWIAKSLKKFSTIVLIPQEVWPFPWFWTVVSGRMLMMLFPALGVIRYLICNIS